MLNPTFPKSAVHRIEHAFVAPADIASNTTAGNTAFETGKELRLQSVYGDEVWGKLKAAGLADRLSRYDVLEVCAGTGFLTYHLLSRAKPRSLTVNDISSTEMADAQTLIGASFPDVPVKWALGDMHTLDFGQTFDLIIGNSFVHHFHDVPKVLGHFASLLKPGGQFVSLHEPTPMATVVESGHREVYLPAVVAPGLINEVARRRYRGPPSPTDIWLFEPSALRKVVRESGFSDARTVSFNLFRALEVSRKALHLTDAKPRLSTDEEAGLARAIRRDALLNRFLPSRFFGAICLVCTK